MGTLGARALHIPPLLTVFKMLTPYNSHNLDAQCNHTKLLHIPPTSNLHEIFMKLKSIKIIFPWVTSKNI